MNNIKDILSGLELTQIGWVVPDIYTSVKFLATSLGISSFPHPAHVCGQDLKMTYYGKIVDGEWLTTQAYNGSAFIELIQPLSGQSMFHDYLFKYPAGGVQHLAFRLPVNNFEQVTGNLQEQNYPIISTVDHSIAQMMFFDTYSTIGLAIEIMSVTPEGWAAIEQMKKAG